jgi:predicted dehydrogenase
MSDPVRVGLAGCGRLAEAGYLPAASRLPGVEIVAVSDPNRARRDVVADALGLAAGGRYETLASLIGAARPDAIVIASPVATHVENASAAAAAGIPALVEKPPAVDAAGARELLALDPAPRIAFNRRFSLGGELPRAAAGQGAPALV